ncbi:hypothetical protein [Caudoviricetes sp.]|nr:hypothetical protein [Caudoviricetes sp.]
MDGVIKDLLGEVGVWVLSTIGLALIAISTYYGKKVIASLSIVEQYSVEIRSLQAIVSTMQRDMNVMRTENVKEVDDIYNKIEATKADVLLSVKEVEDRNKERFHNVTQRIDTLANQTSANYQALSTQLSTMQQELLTSLIDIVKSSKT